MLEDTALWQALAGFETSSEQKFRIDLLGIWLSLPILFMSRVGIINRSLALSKRSGISFWSVKRFQKAAIRPQKLPPIDILLVSHSHYDHLDLSSVKKIKNKDKIQVITPLNLGDGFKKWRL